MSKKKEKAVIAIGGDLDVGGIIKNVKKGQTLNKRQVAKLQNTLTKKDGPSWFDALLKSGAIAEQTVNDDVSEPTTAE